MTRKISWIEVGASVASGAGSGLRLRLDVVAQLLVIGLRSPAHDRAHVVADRPDIPATDPGALGQVDRHDLPRTAQADLVVAIEVEVQPLGFVEPAGVGLGQVLGRDQVFVGREPHVADVDPAEQPVPVGVVRLALVEVVEGARLVVTLGHRVDRIRRPQHLLVHVVDLAVAHLVVAPERAAQPARLGAMPGHRGMERRREGHALVGRERPFAHLGV